MTFLSFALLFIISLISTKAENDFRFISYHDLLPTADRFTDENVTSFSRLLFDVARDQVIVGARDNLYRLSFQLKVREKINWEVPSKILDTCIAKGQSEDDCRNYIMVLQPYGNKLFACGTYAYTPNCSWRQMENLNVTRYDKGVGKCPFNPHANITTLMTESGKMFIGSPTDFSGTDPAILRADISEQRSDVEGKMLRTNQYNSKILNNPQFVGSFEHGEFAYFVFREEAVEFCGKVIYSRIARVCKNDPGGLRFLKDNWTSFLKTRLNCSLPGEYPFNFDEVQGIAYSADEGVLYATFTTPENSIHGSAICSFNMTSIQTAFSGPFRYQDSAGSAWLKQNVQQREHYECRTSKTSSGTPSLFESSKYQLMDYAVQPTTSQPLYFSKLERLKYISLDMISTKLHENVRILYVSTEEGFIKKISVLPRTRETCVIEIWKPEPNTKSEIKTIQFLKETNSLYVGSDNSLIRIPSQRCHRHVSMVSCLNSMDPYCGWNELKIACTIAPAGDTLARHWIQNSTECPIMTASIDGGWSAWSDWFKCAKSDEANSANEPSANGDSCLCRTRGCDNPSAKNGGTGCTGITTMVTNCTVHGGWTDWSAWSACSQTCGVAIKTRKRTCGNPKPAHGGRVCVGTDHSELYCQNLPPCPMPQPPQIDGGWGPWGSWSECNTPCGGGFRIRRRKCDDPEPHNGGMECPGCHIEYEPCNKQACPDVKRMGSWTPWMMTVNGTMDSGHIERRFRFSCKAPVADPVSLKVTLGKEETRVCLADGSCQRTGESNDEGGWGEWSAWSSCSVSCGTGQQYRTRLCDRNDCDGPAKMARACNTHPCKGEWGCWSDWGTCSVSCGVGKRSRTRQCLSMAGNQMYEKDCEGLNLQHENCEMPSCDSFLGWSSWSDWSDCNVDNERTRYRQCLETKPGPNDCLGNEKEVRICNIPQANELEAPIVTGSLSIPWIVLVVLCFGLLCAGIAIFLTKYIIEKKAKGVKAIQGSPCYGAYPNQYSSLPTKDLVENKPKRQSSFNAGNSGVALKITNGHGTLTKSNNVVNSNTPKILAKYHNETDTATIKRNSSALNNMRTRHMDDDNDKY